MTVLRAPILLASVVVASAAAFAEETTPPHASVTLQDEGLQVESEDGAYRLHLGALLQADGRFFLDDDKYEADDTFLVRRFQPTLDGTLFGLADFRLTPDLAGGTLQIMDAYVDFHPRSWVRLRGGKFKGTIGLERLQEDAALPLLERALDQNLSSVREIGAELWGTLAGGLLTYTVGIVNGAPDNTNPDADTNRAKDFQARLFLQPFKIKDLSRYGDLGIGVSASTGNRKGKLPTATDSAVTGLGGYKTTGQLTFFSYDAPPSDTTGAETTFAHQRASHLDPQLSYYAGPFGLLAEYVWSRQGVQRGNSAAILTNQAAHATASFVVDGEESLDGPTPRRPFDPPSGHWGALEVAARYAWLKIDPATFGNSSTGGASYADPSTSARQASSFGVGAGWILRRSARIYLLYERTIFQGGASSSGAVEDRAPEDLLLARVQANF
jgi:phosphate-selective porin OprO/OprP